MKKEGEDQFVLDRFYQIITDNKKEMFDAIAAERTRYLSLVLEDVFQENNASAVIRTCDCFGIQDIHAIENHNKYVLQKKIALGAGRWVDLHRYIDSISSSEACITALKKKGYALAATSPHVDAYTPDTVPIDKPLAVIFGSEFHGLSDYILDNVDYQIGIPMHGFTESFNLSVSAALTVQSIRKRLEASKINWRLSKEEETALKIEWCVKILNGGKGLENSFRKAYFEKE